MEITTNSYFISYKLINLASDLLIAKVLSFQGEKGVKGDPGPMGLPVCI